MTDNNPSVCTNSGTVAVPWFHFYAGWKDGPPAFFSVDWVLIEELTSDHQPQVWYFENLQGQSGFPSGCTMPPVSDPENWNWTTFGFAPMIGFAMHNTSYRITVQWRYGVYMKGPRGPFQTSITINVQNLVVTSPDVGRVLRWDPEKGIADTSFSYNIECAQRKQVQVTVRIYDLNRSMVYQLTEQKMCPGGYGFTWDGTMNVGYGYPPEEGSNIAPAGLYTFDVEVVANPYDRDTVRSQALRVEPGPVEYFGYDDGGTPEDESDDNYLYYLRWYRLYSYRDAAWGEIWLYDPDLMRVQSWAIPMLECVVHGWNDGLGAKPEGEIHGVIISVPVSVMSEGGIYRFVLHFYDDYASDYKNHQVKATLETNQIHKPPTYAILVTTADELMCLFHGKDAQKFLKRMDYTYYKNAISGLQKNLSGRYAIRSLNRLCPLDENNDEAKKKVRKHDVWVFYGHANPIAIGFGYYKDEERYIYRGSITNYRESPKEEIYNIHRWPMSINFVRLAFLHGCGTAGGKTKRWRWAPVPKENSIGYSFKRQGAETVVAWRDTQYPGILFGKFNKWFWLTLSKGASVEEAVNKTLKIIRSIEWRLARPEEREAIEKVVIFGNKALKLVQLHQIRKG